MTKLTLNKNLIFALRNLLLLIAFLVFIFCCGSNNIKQKRNSINSIVYLKADVVDIGVANASSTVFLKNDSIKFPKYLPNVINGLQFTKIFKESRNAVKKAFSKAADTIFIALNKSNYKLKGWNGINQNFILTPDTLYLYRHIFKSSDKTEIDIPQFNEIGTILFSRQIELTNTNPPGTVIAKSFNPKKDFITDPTIVILPNGKYIAGCKSRFDGENSTFRIFESTDKGKSWNPIAGLKEVGFCSLFYHKDALYVMGTKGGFNHAIIRKSLDEGKTWTSPTNSKNGLLMGQSKSYHSAPVPVVINNGRIWRAMEDNIPLGGRNFRAFVMSAPVDADLLDSVSWTCSTPLPYKEEWLSGGRTFNGWLEGNAVVTPSGSIVDIIRIEERTYDGKAGMIHISDDGKTSTFNPKEDIIDFPGGSKKFDIRFDSISKKYWSITNHTFDQDRGKVHCGLTRNRVVLTSSKDLRNWVINDTLISTNDPYFHGYQYINWQFDGDDIIAVSRTAHDYEKGLPVRQHDANYLTFHSFKDFRH